MIAERSQTDIKAGFVEPQNKRTAPLIDYEMGGPVLNQPTGNRFTNLWRAYSDGDSIWVTRDDVEEPVLVLTAPGTTQISLAFDQAMRPHIAYVQAGMAKFYYWETLTNQYQTTQYPGAAYPRICSDDKREFFAGQDDVILAYMKDDSLYTRYQRERYLDEHLYAADTGKAILVQMGMNDANRLQFRLTNGVS